MHQKNFITKELQVVLANHVVFFKPKNVNILLGLTAASFTILFMRIKLEWHSIIFCNFGALFGLVFGQFKQYFWRCQIYIAIRPDLRN